MREFKYLVIVSPLGFLYGSAGAFLSPENLVGRSGAKFPPDASTLAGLFFSENEQNKIVPPETLSEELFVAGPFWAEQGHEENFYVPLPRHRIIESGQDDEWKLNAKREWERDPNKQDIESEYRWQTIKSWERPKTSYIRQNKEVRLAPWKYVSFLHPQLKSDERYVLSEDGLFLENAVQLDDDFCLVYLSTFSLQDGWYRFGGEGHFVEITCKPIEGSRIHELLKPDNKIKYACALITPGVVVVHMGN